MDPFVSAVLQIANLPLNVILLGAVYKLYTDLMRVMVEAKQQRDDIEKRLGRLERGFDQLNYKSNVQR